MKPFFLSAVLLLASCSPKQKEVPVDPYATLPPYFSEVLKAHGGLGQWREFKTLSYDLRHQDDPAPGEHYTMDLLNRKDLTVADSFKIGFDGENVWVAPNKKAFPGKSARFYHNLFSYFFSIPFILADPGVAYSSDTLTVDGKKYDVVKVSFEAGVGDADKDTYQLLIDPNTKQMEKLLYTVTYFSGEGSGNFNALAYEGWEEVNGVRLPTRLTGYTYLDGHLGGKRYEVAFSNIRLGTESPAQGLFEMPTQAEIDSLKKD